MLRAFKVDLTLFEVDDVYQDEVGKWTGRLLMSNLLAIMHIPISMDKALSFILESQRIATYLLKALESGMADGTLDNDHMDYLLQTNLLSFLILWKAKRFDDCKKYIPLCEKLIRSIIKKSEEIDGHLGESDNHATEIINLAESIKIKSPDTKK